MALKSIKKPQQSPAAQQPAPAEARATTSEAQRQKISELAYYRAEQRGFSPGYEMEDWLAAEAEVKKSGAARAG